MYQEDSYPISKETMDSTEGAAVNISIEEVVNSLSKNKIAAIRRVALTLKSTNSKIEKINTKVEALLRERESLEEEVLLWETPIAKDLQGYSAQEIINYIELKKEETSEE